MTPTVPLNPAVPADLHGITVTLNGRAVYLSPASHLADLLALDPTTAALAAEAYATAVNGAFVARAQRSARTLQAGDAVTVFQAIVGG